MIEKLTIYHTNDIHSHFQYWPRIERYFKGKKQNVSNNVFVFDIGDHMDRFHPYSDGTLGKGNISLLNAGGYDAVTIGNNEGITLSHEDLMTLYDEAEFDCILANLYTTDEVRPNWAKPFKIFETASSIKIGVIGVTINYSNFYGPLKWKVTDPFAELKKWVPKVREKVDIVVVLSHLGLSDDERIAHEFLDVDVILGAHTHHVLAEGKLINNSLLCCTGKYGQYVGKVDLLFDHEKKKVIHKQASLLPTENLEVTKNEEYFDKNLATEGKNILSRPIADLPENMEANWFQETKLTQLLCTALTDWCEADCSFINAGILIDGLKKGIVTDYDVHQICPHPINPVTVRLRGAELKEVLLQTIDDRYTSLELKGFGFRGKVFGKIIYDRITFTGKGFATEIRINGEQINPDYIYTVATIDMFAFARFYPEITRSEKEFFLPEFIRDVLKWELANQFPIK